MRSISGSVVPGVSSAADPKASFRRSTVSTVRSDAPGRLVYTEIFEPFPDVESVVTQILTREGRKTRLTVTSSYPSLEVREMVLKTGMEKGAAFSYDRLDDVAQELARIER